jgi:carboxyl-terminal processing protease
MTTPLLQTEATCVVDAKRLTKTTVILKPIIACMLPVKYLAPVIIFLVYSISSHAQEIFTAQQANQHTNDVKIKAVRLWGKDHATPSEIREGVKLLNDELRYLDSLPVRQLASGDIYLYGRKHDVYYDLMRAYCIIQQKEEALDAFENMIKEETTGWISDLETHPVFTPIRSEPRFTVLLNKLKDGEALRTGGAFKTAFQANLTDEEKIAGLSLLWSQATYNFVYFDHIHLDWNKTYLDYLPKVKATRNTIEYYKVLQKFYAQLQDGHTNVFPPTELNKEFYSRPPVRTELIADRVFITGVYSDSLEHEGVKAGLEILQINHQPVIEYADQYVKPYIASSTPQDLAVREFGYFLLSGPENNPLSLTLRDANGKVWEKVITRTGYRDVKQIPVVEYKLMGNIGYLVINNFETNKINTQFDSLFAQIAQTKGLIIDIRNNGGGNSYIGYQILSSLTNQPFKIESSKFLKYSSAVHTSTRWENISVEDIKPNGKQYYSKPVVLLIGAKTFSAAEDFAVAFDYMKRGTMIGQTTGGSTGQPNSFALPGGGSARVCARKNAYPDGKEFVGIGIRPNIEIQKTIEDLIKGRDRVLDAALKEINQK